MPGPGLLRRRISHNVSEVTDLRVIDLRGNPLTALPASITALPALYKLDLRWTPSLALPAWARDLEARGVLVYH